MKYFESFAGVGGIGLGLPKDWELVGLSEVDKYASQVLKYHYPNVTNYGDIKSIDWKQVPDFDVLTGGSPCQDFSIAGKRRGLAGAKSSLAWEFIRGLRDKQPRYFIWENVKGVMSSRGGWDFANLLCAFSESGYSLWWQVLNAKDFGVPQNRERIFVIGTREGSPKEVSFVPQAGAETIARDESDQGTAIYSDDSIPSSKTRRGRVMKEVGTLQTMQKGGIIQLNRPKHSHERVYAAAGLSPALNTMQGGNRQPKVRVTEDGFHLARHDEKSSSIQGTHVTFPEGKSHALGTAHIPMTAKTIRVGGAKSPHGSKQNWDSYEIEGDIRRLTPLECERLMSWPDNWTATGSDGPISDSQRYKMCGNGVVSKVIKSLVKEHFQ